ncbi:MAG: AsmA family protein [Microscillaceae bacterium]|nr:AsmA family protein [Microscillaceae bacterium]
MKKSRIFKWIVYLFLGLVALFLILAILIPIFFKDDIKAQIDKQIAQSINAEVNFDLDKFQISLLRNFPYLSISLQDLSVLGKKPFAGDTLLAVDNFRVTVDLWSALFGSQIKVRGVYLERPRVYAQVLRNGKANWDIMISEPKDTTQIETEKPTKFNVDIRKWKVTKGLIVYDDKALKTYLKLVNLSHSGRGNFNQDQFTLKTSTQLDDMILRYEGTAYLANKKVDADVDLNMDLPQSKYTFLDNKIRINDFAFGFEGFVQMPDSTITMDIKYKAQENEFKNILSLIPGMFTKDFEKIKTDGKLAFDGYVKGKYTGDQLPAFGVNLLVSDAMFQYPDLPTPVSNIQVDVKVENNDGVLDHTGIDLKKFHMDLGKNPVDARAKIQNLNNAMIDAQAMAKINLADLIRMFPMPGTDLRGNFALDLKAKGVYDEHQLPSVSSKMSLQNGYLKSSQYPDALESMRFLIQANNPSGKYEDTKIAIENFEMILDKEKFIVSAFIENLQDITYNLQAKGGIDLEKVLHLYPIEGMEMKGRIKADLETQGKMSYITAEQYDRLPTKGFGSVKDFFYRDAYIPQGFKITEASAKFDPQNIQVEKMDGFLGKSDIHVTGSLSNYMAYLFKLDGVIRGNMRFNSDRFLVDEWMEETTSSSTESSSEAQSTSNNSSSEETYSTAIPKNIDFTLDSYIKEVAYGLIKLNDLKGKILVKDGILDLSDVNFTTLGGIFTAKGLYDTQDINLPKFSFDFGIKSLPLSSAYSTFMNQGKQNAISQNMSGLLSSTFKISGELGADLMPKLNESLNGVFSALISNGLIQDIPLLNNIGSLTGLQGIKKFDLEDVLVKAQIKDGRVKYEPFDIKAGEYTMNVSGSNGIDGSLNFLLNLEVPTGSMGILAKQTLSGLGFKLGDAEKTKLQIDVGGTYLKPKYNLNIIDAEGNTIKSKIDEEKENITENLKDKTKETVKEKLGEDISEKLDLDKNEAAQEIINQAQKQADKIREETKLKAQALRAQADSTEKKALEKAAKESLVQRKLTEAAAKKAKQIAYNQADKIEQEGIRRADQLLAEARKKADALKEE